MYIDAASRKIKDPIDYLIEAEKKSRKLAVPLALAGQTELAAEADVLRKKILTVIDEQPIEVWETKEQYDTSDNSDTSEEST